MAGLSFWSLIAVYVLAALLMLVGALLDHLWAKILGAGKIYRIFVTPGILVHELSHALACLLMGAKVTDMSIFDKEGGHVTHSEPKVPVIGTAVISMAPLFGITLLLLLISILFSMFLNCWFPTSYPSLFSVGAPLRILLLIVEMFYVNLWERKAFWFILFVYLAMALGTCVSPSKQDLKNSAIALLIISILTFGWLFFCNLIGWHAPVLTFIVQALTWALLTGLIFSLLGLAVTAPIATIKWFLKKK